VPYRSQPSYGTLSPAGVHCSATADVSDAWQEQVCQRHEKAYHRVLAEALHGHAALLGEDAPLLGVPALALERRPQPSHLVSQRINVVVHLR
jgi:hypothetical protein